MNKIYQRLQNLHQRLQDLYQSLLDLYERLQNQSRKISFLNKLIIFSIVVLFSFLFYLSIPALYDYDRVQKQLKSQLFNEFNLNFKLSNKIQYKILPYPHFEVVDSIIFTDSKTNQKKLGEIKNLKLFISSASLFNQEKLKLKDIIIRDSSFFLNKNNRKYLNDYFVKKNFKNKLSIKKSKFFLKKNDEIVSIFPVRNFILKYNEKELENQITASGVAFNSNFNLLSKKNFKDNSLETTFVLPKINLSIKNKLLPKSEKNKKFKSYSNINFIGTDLRIESDIFNKYMDFNSNKAKLFNKRLDFSGRVEFEPFFFNSRINLDQINLVKILKNRNFFLELLNNENFIHNNLNGKILLNVDNFSKENIFDRANIFIEALNGELKFDNSLFISENFGNLELVNSVLFSSEKENFIRSNIILEIQNQKKFYNIFQVPKSYRKDLKKINLIIERNLTSSTTKIREVLINSKKVDILQNKLNNIFETSDFNIGENFDNWIALKRFLKQLIIEINSV